MELKGQKVLVVGSGKSGIGAARLLGKAGALPVLFDSNEKLDMTELREKTGDVPGLEIVLGELDEEKKKEIGLVVISPGVPIDAPMLEEYRSKNIPIWGEIELAYAFARLIAIAAITFSTLHIPTRFISWIFMRRSSFPPSERTISSPSR